jgi:hypothetical protein
MFNVLHFGIATAGHIFTKLLRCVVKFWGSLGHKVVMFKDDGIRSNAYFQQANISRLFIQKTLNKLGFLIAQEKCN